MKINEVEALVGITKKNIRFYKEQGLLSPKRNAENLGKFALGRIIRPLPASSGNVTAIYKMRKLSSAGLFLLMPAYTCPR